MRTQIEIPVWRHPEGLSRVILRPALDWDEMVDLPIGTEVPFRIEIKHFTRVEGAEE